MKVSYQIKFIFWVQKLLLRVSYLICRAFVSTDKNLWVVGVVEVANCLNYISGAFEKVLTVNFLTNKFYMSNKYDFSLARLPKYLIAPASVILRPIILGYLANRSDKFFYIWNAGFLISSVDGREFEFSFLKNRKKQIVNFFCGSDIRSPKLSYEHGVSIGFETMVSNLELVKPGFINDEREEFLKMVARVSDTYADHIFNAPIDQISYLQKPFHPFIYFYPDNQFIRNDKKFEKIDVVRIMHAPSSPTIKGTQLVRAAIKSLKEQGYKFEYIEIVNSDNSVVLSNLQEAHIVINELFAFMPGLFSVEAMASHCALLTSADPDIETSLPESCRDAWLIARYWDVSEKIKYLLDHPNEMKAYADRGYEWAYSNCRTTVSQKNMAMILGEGE